MATASRFDSGWLVGSDGCWCNRDVTPTIASAFARALLLILAVANFRHNLVYRAHDRVGSLFRNPMLAILNDNLFPIRG